MKLSVMRGLLAEALSNFVGYDEESWSKASPPLGGEETPGPLITITATKEGEVSFSRRSQHFFFRTSIFNVEGGSPVCEVEVTSSPAISVSLEALTDICNLAKGDYADKISLATKGEYLFLSSKSNLPEDGSLGKEYKLKLFPEEPTLLPGSQETPTSLSVPSPQLARLVNRLIQTASPMDIDHPGLSVQERGPRWLSFSSSSLGRQTYCSVIEPGWEEEGVSRPNPVLLSPGGLKFLSLLLANRKTANYVSVSLSQKALSFQFTEVSTRWKLEATAYDWSPPDRIGAINRRRKALLSYPGGFSTKLEVKTEEALNSLKELVPMAKHNKKQKVSLEIGDEEIYLSAASWAGEVSCIVPARVEGSLLTLAADLSSLIETLTSIQDDYCEFRLAGATSSFVIEPVSGKDGGETERFVRVLSPLL